MGEQAPETAKAQELRAKVGGERWQRLVAEARSRADIVTKAIEVHDNEGLTWVEAVRVTAPELHWSTFVHWRRRYWERSGPDWERLLDERVPPEPSKIPEDVRASARALRVAKPSINAEEAEEALKKLFGADFSISAASLRRIWADAGLPYVRPQGGAEPGETVEEYHGGGGLALVLAADIETGATERLATAVQAAGEEVAEAQTIVVKPAAETIDGGRDGAGRFTPLYNKTWYGARGEDGLDERLAPDAIKRNGRELRTLPTLGMRASTLRYRLLAMGLMPLLTARRGFAGLEGPAGAWLELLGGHAYMPSTLSKGLAELGLLGVNETIWGAHANTWVNVVQRWTADGSRWLQVVAYIDASQDPYWTHRFASSCKVSRNGRVMPGLTEAAITAGPGVPLLAATWAGTVSLKKELVKLITRLDEAVGDSEVGRLLVIDAEMGTKNLLATLSLNLERPFITVLKSKTLEAAKFEPRSEWQEYRTRDALRELDVYFEGGRDSDSDVPKEGFALRAVEMSRPGSRKPRSTVLVTNLAREELSTTEVADAYLSRWPHQEALFRNRRNGGGMNRSHGYGGEFIKYVALETKLERSRRRVDRAERALEQATQELTVLEQTTAPPADQGQPSPGNSTTKPAKKPAKKLVAAAKSQVRSKKQALDKAKRQLAQQETMPREIFARDPGRDNIMTCLKLNMLMLVEFVLKEYFGGPRMELRTFIELLVALPVTVRRTPTRIRYQIHPNPRRPDFNVRLRHACEVINQRRLRTDDRLLVYEVLEPPGKRQ